MPFQCGVVQKCLVPFIQLLTTPLSLSSACTNPGFGFDIVVLATFLFVLKYECKDIIRELGHVKTQSLEFLFYTMSQYTASGGPEICNRFAERDIINRGVCVDIAGIFNFTAGGTVDAMDLGVSE